MRLTDFIFSHVEVILDDWDSFARNLFPQPSYIIELPSQPSWINDAAPPTPPPPPLARNETRVAPLRFLIVEDHTDTAIALSKLLTRWGHIVTRAATAHEALAAARDHAFDIIISDLGLPDMSGCDLMKLIKDQYGLQGIAISGYGMEEDLKRSELAGFSDHLVKPLNLEQLQQSIRRVINATQSSCPGP